MSVSSVRTRTQWVQAAAQQAELVALRVGRHVEALVAGLADIRRGGPQREQPCQLGVLVAVGGTDVDVQPHLARCRLGHRREDDRRRRAAEAGRGADLHAAVLLPAEDLVPEDLGPEGRQGLRVPAVHDELRETAGHGGTLGPPRHGRAENAD